MTAWAAIYPEDPHSAVVYVDNAKPESDNVVIEMATQFRGAEYLRAELTVDEVKKLVAVLSEQALAARKGDAK